VLSVRRPDAMMGESNSSQKRFLLKRKGGNQEEERWSLALLGEDAIEDSFSSLEMKKVG